MIRTYIYGVPRGFDFYEKDAMLNEYFKKFYISSRRGKRLVINRRSNGDTIYSYLRYGLREVERQPLNSFFGMSVVVDGYRYCPDFKMLMERFDRLFETILNRKQLFQENEEGIIQYQVDRFENNRATVEWIKEALSVIFSKNDEENVVSYDESFAKGEIGQVITFNRMVTESQVLTAFKKYSWVSIVNDVVDEGCVTDATTDRDDSVIELDFDELENTLNDLNQQLLPIAVDIHKAFATDLDGMKRQVEEILEKLSAFIPMLQEVEEKAFKDLEEKYIALLESLNLLIRNRGSAPTVVMPGRPLTMQGHDSRPPYYEPKTFSLPIIILVAVVIIVLIAGIVIYGLTSKSRKVDVSPSLHVEDVSAGDGVNCGNFDTYLQKGDYNAAYKCIHDNLQILRKEVENELCRITSGDGELEEKKALLLNFKIEHPEVWKAIGFNDDTLSDWLHQIQQSMQKETLLASNMAIVQYTENDSTSVRKEFNTAGVICIKKESEVKIEYNGPIIHKQSVGGNILSEGSNSLTIKPTENHTIVYCDTIEITIYIQ